MSEYAIRVKNVSKKFKIHHEKRESIFESMTGFFEKKKHSEILQALDNISFDIKHGEIFGIIGPNGGGKSTLLRVISKIYTPDSGSVDVKGTTVREVINNLDSTYPGFKERLIEGYKIKSHISVAVDGIITPIGLLEKVSPTSEVHFLPAISGG